MCRCDSNVRKLKSPCLGEWPVIELELSDGIEYDDVEPLRVLHQVQ